MALEFSLVKHQTKSNEECQYLRLATGCKPVPEFLDTAILPKLVSGMPVVLAMRLKPYWLSSSLVLPIVEAANPKWIGYYDYELSGALQQNQGSSSPFIDSLFSRTVYSSKRSDHPRIWDFYRFIEDSLCSMAILAR